MLTAMTVAAASAQYHRDVIVIGQQRYQRTEQFSHEFDPSSLYYVGVAARDGRCSYTYLRANDGFDYLRHFDSSAQPLHQSVVFDPVQSFVGEDCLSAVSGDHTWTVWYLKDEQEVWGRVFDDRALALGSSFLIAENLNFIDTGEALRLDTNGERVAVAMVAQGQGTGCTDEDVYVRFFEMDGTPLSDVIPLAIDSWYSDEEVSVTVLPDDTTIVAYKHGRWAGGAEWHVLLHRVNPDLTIEPPVEVDLEPAAGQYVRALHDGTFLLVYRYLDCTDALVQRFNADCTPAGDPISLDRCHSYAAATSDGRFALAGYLAGDTLWVQLYDSNAQPLCDPFDFTVEPYADDGFNLISVPLAYDDDGTVWIAWRGDADELITTLRPLEQGDANCDGVVNLFDIDPFILAMTDPSGYEAAYPDCDRMLADTDGDGSVNNFDIDPFVAALVS